MRPAARLAGLALCAVAGLHALCAQAGSVAVPVPVAEGKCAVYEFLNGASEAYRSVCHGVLDFGPDYQFWRPSLPGQPLDEAVLQLEQALAERASAVSKLPIGSGCLRKYLEVLCLTSYQPCVWFPAPGADALSRSREVNFPRQLAHSACETMQAECAASEAQFKFIGFGCDAMFPVESGRLPGYAGAFLGSLSGLPVFPRGPVNFTYDVYAQVGGTPVLKRNTSLVPPQVPAAFNSTAGCGASGGNATLASAGGTCGGSGFFHQTEDCRCVIAPSCPFPAYSARDYGVFLAVVVSLMALSLPFNLAIVASFRTFKALQYIPWAAGLALLYVVLNLVLTGVVGTGFSCVHSEAGFDTAWPAEDAGADPWYCVLSRCSVHLLQMVLNAAVCAYLNVLWAVRAAERGQSISNHAAELRSARLVKIVSVTLFVAVVPLACLAMTLVFGNRRGGKFKDFNLIRFAFSCGPEFNDTWMEIAFVQGPLLLAGLLMLGLCSAIAYVAVRLHGRAGGFQSSAAPEHDDEQGDNNEERLKDHKAEPKKKIKSSEKRRINTALNIAKRVAFFGMVIAVFLVVYTIATLYLLLHMQDFQSELNKFLDCTRGFTISSCFEGGSLGACSIASNTDCSNPSFNVPAVPVMGFWFAAPAVVPLLFGIMFGSTHLRAVVWGIRNWVATCGFVEPLNRSTVNNEDSFYRGRGDTMATSQAGSHNDAESFRHPPPLTAFNSGMIDPQGQGGAYAASSYSSQTSIDAHQGYAPRTTL
jgi:hypothetical protein